MDMEVKSVSNHDYIPISNGSTMNKYERTGIIKAERLNCQSSNLKCKKKLGESKKEFGIKANEMGGCRYMNALKIRTR